MRSEVYMMLIAEPSTICALIIGTCRPALTVYIQIRLHLVRPLYINESEA